MKTTVIAIVAAVSLSVSPVLAQSFDMGTLTPTLDFPKPAPEPVSQDTSGIDK